MYSVPPNFLVSKYFEFLFAIWMFSLCIFTLLGNAASDIWLTGTVVIFLAVCLAERNWGWMRMRWVQIAAVFWVWILIASLLSQWPQNVLKDPLVWIRFPLFAVALPFLLNRYPDARKILLVSLLAGLTILFAVLISEKIKNPDAQRLYGTWGRDLNPKSGWLVVGFGLPVALWALSKFYSQPKAMIWAIPLIALITSAAVLTGEIYVTLSLILGIALFLLTCRMNVKLFASVVAAVSAMAGFVLWMFPVLSNRFELALTARLPWLSSSDYYMPWMSGIETAKLNPLIGVGPRGFGSYCNQSPELQVLFDAGCYHHPHQLYIQIAAETGLIGLGLFLLLFVTLLAHILQARNWRALPSNVTAALCLVITALWPISTYSNAFGQHKNFFTWLIIAFALALASPNNKERQNQG
ncbi:O-antigen ligase [Cohaesibacter sp. ES.047]|uniref:O-antigen ligase family protein n=1 Tax=Cohaesibacter sp. ES.047 TaxID=1798205 RepID=UPI000BB7E74E|nr:O-antigen ligase family protein [Cohaesibacter sp. ES.047]SNY94416.1 O-antigen ligase [Cohaesibacter sp. ES.047]